MDYEAEQAQELEILQSIYTEEEFERITTVFPLRPDLQKYPRRNIE